MSPVGSDVECCAAIVCSGFDIRATGEQQIERFGPTGICHPMKRGQAHEVLRVDVGTVLEESMIDFSIASREFSFFHAPPFCTFSVRCKIEIQTV
jgi:hypothetical protein